MLHSWRGGFAAFAAALLIPFSLADGDQPAANAPDQDRIDRLETMIEQQAKQIQSLQSQLGSDETEAARQAAMRAMIREILSEDEFRESLMPSTMMAGYDNGFYIGSSDEKFLLRVNGRLQFRWTHYATRASNRYLSPGRQRNDRTGFDVQRLRLGFSGHVYDKDLTYRIELQSDASDEGSADLRYAWVNYRFADEFQITAGIFKIASTRGQMTSSSSLQFVDRSVMDAVFQFDRGLGVRFWGHLFKKRLDYYVDVVNSFNGATNRTISTDPAQLDGNPGLVAHLVWHVMGDNPGKDLKSQADHAHLESPALDLGFHYAFNEDEGDRRTTRIPVPLPRNFGPRGGFGLVRSNGLQINQFGFESAFKYRGFSATAEYILRTLDVRRAGRAPFTPLWVLTGDDSTNTQHGAYVQVGYFLPIPGLERKLEAVARVGGISALAGGQEGTWEYAGGLNYYIKEDKIKLQADVTKVSEVPISSSSHSLANVNDDALIFRVQLQVAF
jgi:phosphate-selective porin